MTPVSNMAFSVGAVLKAGGGWIYSAEATESKNRVRYKLVVTVKAKSTGAFQELRVQYRTN